MNKIFSFIIVSFIFSLSANANLRNCEYNDLVGTWAGTFKKLLVNNTKSNIDAFLMPTQLLIFSKDGKIKSLYSTNKSYSNQDLKLLKLSPYSDTYKIEQGVISYFNNGKLIDMAKCDIFEEDKKLSTMTIQKGSMSLIRMSNGKPVIVNAYQKIE